MIMGLIIIGICAVLFVYLGYRDWHHLKLPENEAVYIKYSSPELYIMSILGIFIGAFISFGLKITLVVILVFLPIFYLFLKIYSPYFEFLPPRS